MSDLTPQAKEDASDLLASLAGRRVARRPESQSELVPGNQDASGAERKPEAAEIESTAESAAASPSSSLKKLSAKERIDEAAATDAEQSFKLRRRYARSLLIGLGIQILAVDGIFLLYAYKGAHWAIPAATMNVWIAATVVQVVGVVAIVSRYLFPLGRSQ